MALHNLKLLENNGKYTYKELKEPDNITDDEYWDWLEDNNIILFDDDSDGTWDDLIVYFDSMGLEPHIITWQRLEDELDKDIVEELKKKHYCELPNEYWNPETDEPDEQVIKFEVIIPEIQKL